jgi:DnaK suppressor protein
MPKSTKAAVARTDRASTSSRSAAAQGAKTKTAAKATKSGAKSAARTPAKRAGSAKAAAPAAAGAGDRFLSDQRTALIAEREASMHQADALREEAEQLAEEMEPGDTQFDEESGEGGTLNVERERDLALSAQARAAVEEIDRALAKIDSGAYGTCEQCGQPIPKARLKALPYATLCVACKSGGLSRR